MFYAELLKNLTKALSGNHGKIMIGFFTYIYFYFHMLKEH